MNRWAAASFLTLLCAASIARADQCDAMVAKLLQQERGMTFAGKSPSLKNTFLRHPLTSDLVVSCSESTPDAFLSWDSAFPSKAFFALGGRVGAVVLGKDQTVVVRSMHSCHQKALANKAEGASVSSHGVLVECQAFTRDGGGATFNLYTE